MVPVAEGLFEQTEQGPRLRGSRCNACGTVYFPVAMACRNPSCDTGLLECFHLPPHGKLISYTIQRYQPPPLFRMDDWKPYAIGLVDLGEGVEVMGMLSGFAFDEIEIGVRVELVIEPLYRDDTRGLVTTYKFVRCA